MRSKVRTCGTSLATGHGVKDRGDRVETVLVAHEAAAVDASQLSIDIEFELINLIDLIDLTDLIDLNVSDWQDATRPPSQCRRLL